MNETIITLENVHKTFRIFYESKTSVFDILFSRNNKTHYEELKVLENISFNVKKGETLGIMGRNGSGKTTLLKIMAKILNPDKGKITVNGKTTPFLGLGTGFNGEMSARDNLILYGVIMGLSKEQMINKIPDILKFSELEKFEDTKLKHFSSGMFARIAFSAAIHLDPEIMLVDEVLAVGDISFRRKSYETFANLKNQNRSIVMVSHNSSAIKKLCDRVIVLEKGKIVFNGNPVKAIDFYEDFMSKK